MGEEDKNFTDDARKTLRAGIKSSVKSTNTLLASMEQTFIVNQSNFVSRLTSFQRQLRFVLNRAIVAYQARQQYGPEIVSSSALVLGGVTALRRGKIPGATVGIMAGSAAYAAVYGIPTPE